MEVISLVHKDQSCRVADWSLLSSIVLLCVKVGSIDRWAVAWRAAWLVHDLPPPVLIFESDLIENGPPLPLNRIQNDILHFFPPQSKIVVDPGGSIDHRNRVEQRVDGAIVFHFACPWIAWNDLIRASIAHGSKRFANAGWSVA
jgi:hypothetical protein